MKLYFSCKSQIFFKHCLGGIMGFFLILQTISSPALALSPYSNHELEELEKEFIQLINQSQSIERNPLATQYINHLGKKLAHFAHIPPPYFFIVKSSEINAFAGPGGYIGLNTQLILATENESELAAVMAHEIAHVRLHHLYELIQHQKQMRVPMLASLLASLALGVVNPTLGSGALMASISGFAQDNINFTRANEKAADRIGIDMLIKAGFNPKAMASFFKKMQENMRYYYTANIPAILRTHPLDEDRIAEAENRSEGFAAKSADSLNYHLFKELIRVSVNLNSKQLLDYYQSQCQKKNSGAACQYGYVLALLASNQYQQAQSRLNALLAQDQDNLFYQAAMAQAESGNNQFEDALNRLRNLQANYPENYAALMAYGQGLLAAGKTEQAASVFLKGSRQFPNDLTMCEALARAEAASHHKDYAYFTKAKCQLLQGRQREAMRQLRQARLLAKSNPYLLARINALMEEIKFLTED
jgi:predicted Zn-dependent protease